MPFESVTGRAIYRGCHWVSFYGFTFAWSLRVKGREHLPAKGPSLLLANHQSFIDPILIGGCSTRALTYLARSNLWDNRFVGRMISAWGAVPIDRGFGKEGLQAVLAELAKGRDVVMFPEGERTHTGELQPLKPGVALLVKRVTCPIIPVGIAGAFEAYPRSRKLPFLDSLILPSEGRSMALAFGPPLAPGSFVRSGREEIVRILETAMRAAYENACRIRRKPAHPPATSLRSRPWSF